MGVRAGLSLLLLVAILAIGCTKQQTIAGVGLGIAGVGIGVAYGENDDSGGGISEGQLGVGLIVIGLATTLVAAAVFAPDAPEPIIKVEREATGQRIERVAPARETKRDTARDLTRRAREAAARADCADVVQLSGQVYRLDIEVHMNELMADPAILRCFQQPAP